MLNFNKDQFIKDVITKRQNSLFQEDLLANHASLKDQIYQKKVLVIGGAGTIGSNYIKAILPYHPDSLTVVDYSENGLTELTRDLRSQSEWKVPSSYITYPFDFGSSVFSKLMEEEHFDIIACFAAHKHVRSEKDHLAIEAMVRNNVFNTEKLIRLALKKKPSHFFSVSTDKAANPVNVMGATKKLMEKVLLSYSKELKISTARFANVAFSNGSLLDGFIYRVMKGQPLSAPADVKRYFVSPEESGQLCLIASILGESSDIFFPKLGEDQMLTFSEIAEQFLQSLGYACDYSSSEEEARKKAEKWNPSQATYPVYFFKSDTSGEKLYEEFYEDHDEVDFHSFKELGIVKNAPIPEKSDIDSALLAFKDLFNSRIQKSDIITLLNEYLPGFSHIETGKSLDHKM